MTIRTPVEDHEYEIFKLWLMFILGIVVGVGGMVLNTIGFFWQALLLSFIGGFLINRIISWLV